MQQLKIATILVMSGLVWACGQNAEPPQSANPGTAKSAAPPPAARAPEVPAVSSEKSPLDGYETKKVSAHVYVVHGSMDTPNKANQAFINNPAFVVMDGGVAVVDPGSSHAIGKAVVARIKQVTDKPVTHVFNTHAHGDHWLGNQGIAEAFPGAKIYAHPKMLEEVSAGAGPRWVAMFEQLTEGTVKSSKPVGPTEVLADGQELRVHGMTYKVYLTEHSHTKTDAMIQMVEEELLFTGDNVNNGRIVRMDDGSFRGNVEAVARVLSLPVKVVVPGHGPTGDASIMKPYHDYLDRLFKTVSRLRDSGKLDFEMKPEVAAELKDFETWAGFDDELGKQISLALLEAERAEF